MAVEPTQGEPDNYQFYHYDCIVKCCGCDFISFYAKHIDIEAGMYDIDGKWKSVENEEQYPEINEKIFKIKDFHLVPPIVSQIYNETISSLKTRS